MAIDRARQRLFVGCHNKMMAVLDTGSGKVVATVPIGEGVDANAFDPDSGEAFASCGDGTLTVIGFKNGPARVTEVVVTQAGARTGAVDPATGLVYLPTAALGPPEKAGGRPSIVPDTLKVLVIGRQ